MKALAIGGTSDHMHVLLSIPATMPVAKALKLIKAGSSKSVNEHLQHRFEWQEGYGAFTVGIAQKGITPAYIRNQASITGNQALRRNIPHPWRSTDFKSVMTVQSSLRDLTIISSKLPRTSSWVTVKRPLRGLCTSLRGLIS